VRKADRNAPFRPSFAVDIESSQFEKGRPMRAPRYRSVYAFLLTAGLAAAQQFVVLDDQNRLHYAFAGAPAIVHAVRPVLNLAPGDQLVGVDVRPATGELYALGAQSRLYVVDQVTGVATQIGPVFTTALSGVRFGFDFNPTVDRIRVVSDTGQNLRLHPTTGAVVAVDLPLAYAAGDVNAAATPVVGGAGYTNSLPGATTTVLYDVDAAQDVLVTQIPPNNGVLNTVGSLGIDVSALGGFDIAGDSGLAFAALTPAGGAPTLYRVNLTTGALTSQGALGVSAAHGFALVETPPSALVAVTGANQLVFLDAGAPQSPLATIPVTGLAAGETLEGVDFRPTTGQLYALGATSRLYTIDLASGAATQVGPVFSTLLSGTRFGFDFNPTVDRIRVVSDAGQNLRLHPTTGMVVAVDGALAYAAGDVHFGAVPAVAAGAYVNSIKAASSATVTTLFDVDAAQDVLVTQAPPNNGTLNTVGPLGVDATGFVAFEISGETGAAYAAFVPAGGATTNLYRVSLRTGAATLSGALGVSDVRGLAAAEFAGASRFGRATAGAAGRPAVAVNGPVRPGTTDFSVFTAGAPSFALGMAAFTPGALGAPLAASQALIYVDVLSPAAFLHPFFADATGRATFMFSVPADPLLIGATFFMQTAFTDAGAAGGVSATVALSATVVP
jgi:hypothetical protein